MTIGRWPEWSVTAARERAKELRRMIDEGQDPLAAKKGLREAPRVSDMIDRYIREHLPKLRPRTPVIRSPCCARWSSRPGATGW
jgi:hypothetical protein